MALPGLERQGGGAAIEYAPPGSESDGLRRPPHPNLRGELHAGEGGLHARLVFDPGRPRRAARPAPGGRPVQLVRRTPGRGRGRPPHRRPAARQSSRLVRHLHPKITAGTYEGAIAVQAGGFGTRVPVPLGGLRLRPPGRELAHHDGVFRALAGGALPGPPAHRPLPPLRAPQPRRARRADDVASAEAAASRFDGSDFTAAHGYEGPGVAVGNRMAPASFFEPGPDYGARIERVGAVRRVDDVSRGEAPLRGDVSLPARRAATPPITARLREVAANVKSNPGPGRALPLLATTKYVAGLDGAVDLWYSPAEDFDPATAAAQRARGQRYWFYNGRRPPDGRGAHRRSGHRCAGERVGGVQARLPRVLLLAREHVAAQPAEGR